MTRRAAPFLALLLAASACERHPVAPARVTPDVPLSSHESGDGPPTGHAFGPDTYTTEGPYTGKGIVTPGLECAGSATALSCSGYLPSAVDGTMLDVLLMVPNASGPFPLVVVMHGWGGSKNGEGDIARALVADGYAVLRYSARGFGDSWGRVNLADVNVERRDLQSIVSHVVDHPGYRLNPDAVAVTGASYGGAHSWFALVEPTFSTPRGNTVKIRTVVPIAAWSDLVASLIPNGHRSSLDPRGTLKFSYVNALYFGGQREPGDGPEPWYDNYPDYLRAWHALLTTTEPTANPLYEQIRDGLGGYRSIWWNAAFWNAVTASPVPVFQLHGFTDDLFTFDEPKRMLLALKTVNPAYPIASYFGDVGHPRARNKPAEVDYALGLIRTWLAYYLKGVGAQPAHVIHAAITRPADEAFSPGNVISVASYGELATGSIDTTFSGTAVLLNPVSGAPSGPFRDPILEAGMAGAGELAEYFGPAPKPDPTAAAYEVSVDAFRRGTFLIAGQPTVTFSATTGQSRVQFNVRLFDVGPGGAAHLVTRGTYTLDTKSLPSPLPVTHRVTVSTQGNLWRADPGHVLRLEITNADIPYLSPAWSVPPWPDVRTEISGVKLTMPVR